MPGLPNLEENKKPADTDLQRDICKHSCRQEIYILYSVNFSGVTLKTPTVEAEPKQCEES